MTDPVFVLTREQRHEIIRAVNAIERRVTALVTPDAHADIAVIWNNLAIIRTNLMDRSGTGSN
jgi:hypothetical protein